MFLYYCKHAILALSSVCAFHLTIMFLTTLFSYMLANFITSNILFLLYKCLTLEKA